MTLWELAKDFRLEASTSKIFGDTGDAAAEAYEEAAEKLEQWAREKAKEYSECAESFDSGILGIEKHRVLADLGVPEDK